MRAIVELPNLELHVTHACNLRCESCSHYSNHGHKGDLSLEEARAWMAPWAARLAPRVFSLLGGEPTIHPQLADFVPLVRAHWPGTHIRIVSNGFFLHRQPRLPQVLARDPDAALYLSLHHAGDAYRDKVAPALALVDRWRAEHGIRVVVYRSSEHWTRRYHGQGAAMQPFADGQPRQSWEQCSARFCPQLFEGRIWKCAPLAYLPMQHARFGLGAAWAPYLGYLPLPPDSSDAQAQAFFAREEEAQCSMCPSRPQTFAMPDPLPRRADNPAPTG